jgi:hypothetical protein
MDPLIKLHHSNNRLVCGCFFECINYLWGWRSGVTSKTQFSTSAGCVHPSLALKVAERGLVERHCGCLASQQYLIFFTNMVGFVLWNEQGLRDAVVGLAGMR